MLKFKKILILFAGIILVLHSTIPHQHNSVQLENVIGTTQESSVLLDFISLALHLDLGNNHLENFIASEDNFEENIDDAHFPFIYQELIIPKKINLTSNSISLNVGSKYLVAENIKFTNQFRGPPSVIS